ncbi:class I SAM-dependent methyltransferase [Microtetraspora niveoalba]|uniref:class I SAM-dependent methyltransferase n=1 Tax=Microtetraspora niveoalba TaxID=46175 RepID=UPI000829DDD4|nr:class I SAM-dependent methyltransferase [Microtetraspora niveoalba]
MIEPLHLSTTRESYDRLAGDYVELVLPMFENEHLDRAAIAAFAGLVRAGGAGEVADLGCGPGHVTAHLHTLGLTAFGVDLSPEMIGLARRAYPHLRFDVGSMTDLDLADGVLGGVLARYSIIHTPPDRLPEALAEFYRVLAPGGLLLLSFQAHDEPSAPPEAFDHAVATAYRWSPDRLAELLRETGLVEVARLILAGSEDAKRGFPQAHLLVRKPVES